MERAAALGHPLAEAWRGARLRLALPRSQLGQVSSPLSVKGPWPLSTVVTDPGSPVLSSEWGLPGWAGLRPQASG